MMSPRHITLACVLWLCAGLLACSDAGGPSPESPPEPVRGEEASRRAVEDARALMAEAEVLARAQAAAKQLGQTLKTRLVGAMTEGGPEAAIELCSAEAQSITSAASAESGVRLGRASLRTRNPSNVPPAWVRAWLEEQGERPVEGVEGFARVSGGPEGRRAEFLMPIGVEGPCLVCHGDPGAMPDGVRSLLEERYPEDRATGYALGDLRGALWAEALIDAPGGR